jgi:hypothetical protein
MSDYESQKTGGLTALGVLSVVLGALFFVAGAWGMLAGPDLATQPAGTPPVLSGMSLIFAYTDGAMNALLGGLLFVAGIGLLKLRTWGRRLAIWYGIVRLVWSVVGLMLGFLGPYMHRPGVAELTPEQAEFMTSQYPAIVLTQLLTGAVLSSAFAVILLCLLSRRNYQDALV